MSNSATPDAVAPPARNPRFPLIDGMRAIAALSVLVVHVAFFSEAIGDSLGGRLLAHLNVGVTVFFVISGFLLYRPLVFSRAEDGPPRTPVSLYGWRRFLRIYPAYWLLLVILALLPGLAAVSGGHWLSQFAMLWTLPFAQGGGLTCQQAFLDCGVAQTWSLVVELSFYAVLPLYALAIAALGRRLRQGARLGAELTLLAVLAVASTVLLTVATDAGSSGWIGGTLIGYGLWFALGMTLALVSVAIEGRPAPAAVRLIRRAPLLPWMLALVIYVALSRLMPPTPFLLLDSDRLLTHLGFAAIALLLMLPAVFCEPGRGAPARLLGSPPAAWLGLISYGIFLWHYVIALELGDRLGFLPLLAATLALSIAAATASYYLLEQPLLRFKNPGRIRGGEQRRGLAPPAT